MPVAQHSSGAGGEWHAAAACETGNAAARCVSGRAQTPRGPHRSFLVDRPRRSAAESRPLPELLRHYAAPRGERRRERQRCAHGWPAHREPATAKLQRPARRTNAWAARTRARRLTQPREGRERGISASVFTHAHARTARQTHHHARAKSSVTSFLGLPLAAAQPMKRKAQCGARVKARSPHAEDARRTLSAFSRALMLLAARERDRCIVRLSRNSAYKHAAPADTTQAERSPSSERTDPPEAAASRLRRRGFGTRPSKHHSALLSALGANPASVHVSAPSAAQSPRRVHTTSRSRHGVSTCVFCERGVVSRVRRRAREALHAPRPAQRRRPRTRRAACRTRCRKRAPSRRAPRRPPARKCCTPFAATRKRTRPRPRTSLSTRTACAVCRPSARGHSTSPSDSWCGVA